MLGPLWLNADGTPLRRGQFYPAKTTYTNKPVVVLQNGVCFSATEGFISTMRELPNVTIMGDTTGGGSAAPRDFPISEGFTIHLSTLAQLTYEGKFIEWNGIEPDILVKQSKEELDKGRDIQLEEAIGFLMEE
jgi:C-terminal processing protease CtpA/Prc